MNQEPGEQQLRSAPFYLDRCLIDPKRDRIIRDGDAVRVEPKVMDLLLALCVRPGEVVSKEQLLERVWDGSFVTEHVLTHAVWQLRKALRDSKLVEAISKRGYRVTADVEPADLCVMEEKPEKAIRPTHSVVVLPLANLTGDPDQEYFAEGMTDALISHLAHLQTLRVISRASAMYYKDHPKPVREIGQELNVDAVITGSVFREGSQVRISAQLLDAKADTHLWAGDYVRDLANVFELQSELADAISQNVTNVLDQPTPGAMPRKVNPAAYEAYLQGHLCESRLSPENLAAALSYFEEAAKLDDSFAQPYSGIALMWFLRENTGLVPSSEAMPRARDAAERAIALDERAAGAHSALGLVKLHYDWDWAGAEAEFLKSIELNPNDPTTRIFYADLLYSMGRSDEGLGHIRYGMELDPLNPNTRCFYAWYLLFSRRVEQAIFELEGVTHAEPVNAAAHQGLWGAFYLKKNWEAALREGRTFFSIRAELPIHPVESAETDETQYRAAMLYAADTLRTRAENSYVPNLRIARLYAHANHVEAAFDWLYRAFDQREGPLVHLAVGWDWDNLRGDARFDALLSRLGLSKVANVGVTGAHNAHN